MPEENKDKKAPEAFAPTSEKISIDTFLHISEFFANWQDIYYRRNFDDGKKRTKDEWEKLTKDK